MSKYFFGRSVKNNRVVASSARTFKDLVQKHLEPAFKLAITQEQYLTLKTKKEKLDAKDSPYLVACTFTSDESSRAEEFASDECNLIFLDLDEEADGRCPAKPFVETPELLNQSLSPFSFAAYTTASSTNEKPRMRVVVEASGIPLSRYPKAVQTIGQRLGLSSITRESLIPNQPMICPSLFCDQDPDNDHPLFLTSLRGQSFTVDDIQEEEALPGTVTTKTRHRSSDNAEDDGLEFLRAPLTGFTLEMAKDALKHISPTCSYFEWLDIAMALHHQWGGATEAFTLFDEWSQDGTGYPGADGEKGTRKKWDCDIHASPRGRVPITIRTLIKRAMDNGWNADKANSACFETVKEWIENEANTLRDLTHNALLRIAGLPNLTNVEEVILLTRCQERLKSQLMETVSINTLKNDLKRIKNVAERTRKPSGGKDHPWPLGWTYVTCDEHFFRPASHHKMSPKALDASYSRFLLPSEDNEDATDAELCQPSVLPSIYLLNLKKCEVADEYNYDPSNPNTPHTITQDGLRLVNTYRKSYPSPDRSTAQQAGKMWLKHIANLISEPEYQRVLTDFFAFLVQHPGQKIRWAPLIQGAEGCGKTLIAKILGTVLGTDNVNFVNNDGIRSQWNDWVTDNQVVIVPEIYVSGKNRDEIMNRMKELVTDDRISINQRNRTVRTARNITNFVMFTNHHDALKVQDGSRRYWVIKSALQTEDQVLALGDTYFTEIFHELETNAAGLRAFFEDWEISEDFPADGRAPKTKYLEELIEDSADDLTGTIQRLIKEGESPLISVDLIASGQLKAALELEGVREPEQRVGKVLRELNYVKAPRAQINGVKEYYWVKSGMLHPKQAAAEARRRLEKQEQEDIC